MKPTSNMRGWRQGEGEAGQRNNAKNRDYPESTLDQISPMCANKWILPYISTPPKYNSEALTEFESIL